MGPCGLGLAAMKVVASKSAIKRMWFIIVMMGFSQFPLLYRTPSIGVHCRNGNS